MPVFCKFVIAFLRDIFLAQCNSLAPKQFSFWMIARSARVSLSDVGGGNYHRVFCHVILHLSFLQVTFVPFCVVQSERQKYFATLFPRCWRWLLVSGKNERNRETILPEALSSAPPLPPHGLSRQWRWSVCYAHRKPGKNTCFYLSCGFALLNCSATSTRYFTICNWQKTVLTPQQSEIRFRVDSRIVKCIEQRSKGVEYQKNLLGLFMWR